MGAPLYYVIKFLRFIFYSLQVVFSIWVLTGEYRKFTVFLYLSLKNVYFGDMKLSNIVMFGEAIFVLFCGCYFFFLLLLYFRKKGRFLSLYEKLYWGPFFVFCFFFLMHNQLYS